MEQSLTVRDASGRRIVFVFLMGRIMTQDPRGTALVRDVGVGITVLFAELSAVHLSCIVLQTTSLH